MENFESDLRIVTQEEYLRSSETVPLLEVKAQLYEFFEIDDCTLKQCIIDSLYNPDLSVIMANYKIKRELSLRNSC